MQLLNKSIVSKVKRRRKCKSLLSFSFQVYALKKELDISQNSNTISLFLNFVFAFPILAIVLNR